MTEGITAAAGLVCLVAAVLIWTVGNKHTPRLTVALIVAGVVGILGTRVGTWVRSMVQSINGLIGGLTGSLFGVAVSGLLVAAALYVLVVHVKNKKISKLTLACAALVPIGVTTIPGAIGEIAATGVRAVGSGMGWAVSSAMGL